MKTIVIYYSGTGNNQFLAKKIAQNIDVDIEELKTTINFRPLIFLGLTGIKKLEANLQEYDLIILCGPIWMGKLIAPLKRFISKQAKNIKQVVFATCCGSSAEMKDKKFGHGLVFKEIKAILNDKCIRCEAFPTTLILPDDKKNDQEAVMQARLNDENFTGAIKDKFDDFIQYVKDL